MKAVEWPLRCRPSPPAALDIFSGLFVGPRGEAVITDFGGNPVRIVDNTNALHEVVATTNEALHAAWLCGPGRFAGRRCYTWRAW